MNGDEKFTFNGNDLDFGILEFWKSKYSSIHNIKYVIAEFIVEQALDIKKSYNNDSWTLYDIEYRDKRIEVKESCYYHPWNNDKVSEQRTFSIGKAYSNDRKPNSLRERQNDIYVFCLNNGETEEKSNPLILDNWEFYIIPTKVINEKCNNQKTISIGRVRRLFYDNYKKNKLDYYEIKPMIDQIIDEGKI